MLGLRKSHFIIQNSHATLGWGQGFSGAFVWRLLMGTIVPFLVCGVVQAGVRFQDEPLPNLNEPLGKTEAGIVSASGVRALPAAVSVSGAIVPGSEKPAAVVIEQKAKPLTVSGTDTNAAEQAKVRQLCLRSLKLLADVTLAARQQKAAHPAYTQIIDAAVMVDSYVRMGLTPKLGALAKAVDGVPWFGQLRKEIRQGGALVGATCGRLGKQVVPVEVPRPE